MTTLLDAGAKIDAVDVRGMTPLMLAITSDRPDPAVVRVLFAHGADAGIKSKAGRDGAGLGSQVRPPRCDRGSGRQAIHARAPITCDPGNQSARCS